MVDITPLFESTSLTPPRAPPAAAPPQASADALASALLIGIVQDLSALKAAIIQQATINRILIDAGQDQVAINRSQVEASTGQDLINAEVGKLIERHNLVVDRVDVLATILAEMDERLYALDGKRSLVITSGEAAPQGEPEPAAA